ncbi:MAG: T9SS type A sorting domain-containing protein [Crocinitomix sp.]|nr:T9SS type A sorting domain-containing protein [Crocinitomix sp.]
MKKIFYLALILCFNLNGFSQAQQLFFEAELDNDEISPVLVGDYSLLEVNEVYWEEILSTHPSDLSIEIPFQDAILVLNVYEVELIRDDFIVRTASGQDIVYNDVSRSIFYRGEFEGYPDSHFAFSVLNNEIIGVGSIPGIGDVNLGKLENDTQYIFFPEESVNGHNDFKCDASDDPIDGIEMRPNGDDHGSPKDLGDCVGIYFEVDQDITIDKGGVIGATDYITAMFNEIYILYDIDGMTAYISDMFVWDAPSPYAGITSTTTLLNLFGTTTPVWIGDLGHFVSYRGNGGLAWLNVICHPNQALRKAVSDINSFYEEVPIFSWTIEVIAHEMGHNFGSPHTHACAWNGDGTAIDGCGPAAGYDEGCDAAIPASGTIMSYCHLIGAGIDLGLGFGDQPGALMRGKIEDAACLEGCDLNPFMDIEIIDGGLVGPHCEGDSIYAEVTIFSNGNEDLTTLDLLVYLDGVLEETILWTGLLEEDSSEVVALTPMLLPPGTYLLEVELENPNGVEDGVLGNNTYEIEFDVTEYPIVDIISATDISCFGLEDGAIDIDVSGGTPGYTYDWDNGAGVVEDPTDIGANTYTVIVTDDAGCEVTIVQELTQPTEIIVTTEILMNPDCFYDETGEIEVSAEGGSPGYTYAWSSGGDGTIETGLGNGEYIIVVTDENDCSASDTVDIISPPELLIETEVTQAGCGMDNGEVTTSMDGGVPGYEYDWSSGDITADVTGLFSDTYDLTVTDENGCILTIEVFVPEDPAPEIVIETILNINCFGDELGAITVSGVNINGVAEYNWSTGDIGTDLTDVGAGDYTVILTDDSNCSDEETITITENDEIIIDPFITAISCYGSEDGEVIVAVEGGIPGYDYSWSTGAVTAGIDDLAPGLYEITITDELDCIQTLEIEIVEPDSITIVATFDDEFCDGENGFVDLTITGGSPGYEFAWSTGAITEDIDGLAAGIYNVLVTDLNGCTNSFGVILDNIDNFEAEISQINANCYDEPSGSGTIDVISGTGPYTYDWSDGQITATAVDLIAGTYTVTVTDANGCEESFEIDITSPDEIEVASSISNEVFGGDGFISTTTIGGVPGYTYLWNTGATTEDIEDLVAGTYTLTITDANGCSITIVYVVDSQLSLDDFGQNIFVVYPNPAQNEIWISNGSNMDINSVKLYNAIGQLVYEENTEANSGKQYVDVSYFADGVYFVVLDIEGKLAKSKVLIQK